MASIVVAIAGPTQPPVRQFPANVRVRSIITAESPFLSLTSYMVPIWAETVGVTQWARMCRSTYSG